MTRYIEGTRRTLAKRATNVLPGTSYIEYKMFLYLGTIGQEVAYNNYLKFLVENIRLKYNEVYQRK